MLRQTFIVERRTIARVACRKCGIEDAKYGERVCHYCRKEERNARSGYADRKPLATVETDTPIPGSLRRF